MPYIAWRVRAVSASQQWLYSSIGPSRMRVNCRILESASNRTVVPTVLYSRPGIKQLRRVDGGVTHFPVYRGLWGQAAPDRLLDYVLHTFQKYEHTLSSSRP